MVFIHEWNLPTDIFHSRMSWWRVWHFTEHSQMPKCRWFILGYNRSYSNPFQSYNYIYFYAFTQGGDVCHLIILCAGMGDLALADHLSLLSSAFSEDVLHYDFHCLTLSSKHTKCSSSRYFLQPFSINCLSTTFLFIDVGLYVF